MGYSIITLQGMNAAYEAIHGVNIFNGISLPEGIDFSMLGHMDKNPIITDAT